MAWSAQTSGTAHSPQWRGHLQCLGRGLRRQHPALPL